MNSDVKTEVISSGPDLTLLGLFFQADPFVKGVMFLLIFASIWCWAIIINKYALLRNERKYFNLSNLDNNVYIIKVASSNFLEQIKMIIIK